MHFVARKHGLFFLNNDDVDTARYIAIRNITKLMSSEFEFDDRKHLNCVMEKNFKHAVFGMMSFNSAKKRDIDIRVESEFITDESRSESKILEVNSPLEDPQDSEFMDDVKQFIKDNENEENNTIFKMFMDGYSNVDIANHLGITPESVRQRKNRIIKTIKNEVNKNDNRRDVKEVRARVWSEPTSTHKAKHDSYSEAMSYLGLASEIRD